MPDEELKKQLSQAADVLLNKTISERSPTGCPERQSLNHARIDLFLDSLSVYFTCLGDPNLPVCRACSIKGSFQLNPTRGKVM